MAVTRCAIGAAVGLCLIVAPFSGCGENDEATSEAPVFGPPRKPFVRWYLASQYDYPNGAVAQVRLFLKNVPHASARLRLDNEGAFGPGSMETVRGPHTFVYRARPCKEPDCGGRAKVPTEQLLPESERCARSFHLGEDEKASVTIRLRPRRGCVIDVAVR